MGRLYSSQENSWYQHFDATFEQALSFFLLIDFLFNRTYRMIEKSTLKKKSGKFRNCKFYLRNKAESLNEEIRQF